MPGRAVTYIDYLQRLIAGEIPPPPVATTVGFTITAAEGGTAVAKMEADAARHANPMGTVHGGILIDLADAAMGCAVASLLQPEETFTTLELGANFLKPVWKASLTATGHVVKRTRSTCLVEADVVDEAGSLVCHAHSTCMFLHGEKATGR
jgi:uncharacterized protein (TIGR00369 family)